MHLLQEEESSITVTHNRRNLKESLIKTKLPNGNSERKISINCNRDDYAVFIRNAHKRYDTGPAVLHDFCMNVRKGTIYGLLGSSGCGKTTILSCIVGLQQCDSGKLLVFGKKPGTKDSGIPGKRLGYMPQELALYAHLSIREIIQFYGRIYCMTSKELGDQWDFLNSLLKLPSSFKLIGDLSGGQQRRVSLALALIHSPELLILDEPTVGLDPLLRRDIWDYLYQIVERLKTTIIITTHYIEEARLSNTIGVMRNGRLLVEDTPMNLLAAYNCELLEGVVLKLCRKDTTTNANGLASSNNYHNHNSANQEWKTVSFKSNWDQVFEDSNEDHQITNGVFRKSAGFDCDISQNQHIAPSSKQGESAGSKFVAKMMKYGLFHTFQKIYGFTVVILLTFIRNPVFMVSLLFMPSIQGTITLLTLGSQPRGLKIGIVNHELANWTSECGMPQHSGDFCDLSALSCKFLNRLKRDDVFTLNSYTSEAKALSDTQLGKIWGYLEFPENYSQHNLDFVSARQFSFNESIEGSRIHAHLDHSQFLQVYLMIKHLYASYMEYVRYLADSCQIGGEQAELPIHFLEPVYGTNDDNYSSFIIPGLILLSLGGVGYGPTGVLLVSDRKQGTLSRAHVAGLATVDVFSSHLITQGIIAVGQIIIWSAILHFGFNFVSHGSPWLMIAFYLLTQLLGTGIGIVAGLICNEEQHVLLIAVFCFTIFMFSGCALFPMELVTPFWRFLSYMIPTTLPILSLRSVTVRGMGLSNPLVWSGLLVLVVWIFVLLLVAVVVYKRCNK